ncbi:unnamed protein product [Rodentolepis nana]|uniref:Uncharacterized protein n=1 Tax=Rodentolepis nana TaxID=102285 RepID=A0A0R3TF21_RODNA|nr:unnamed protein product [Rodentolepis nana]
MASGAEKWQRNKSQLFSITAAQSGLSQLQPDRIERMPSLFMNGVAAENLAYQSPELKTNSRSFRRSLLGGLFRRDHVSHFGDVNVWKRRVFTRFEPFFEPFYL